MKKIAGKTYLLLLTAVIAFSAFTVLPVASNFSGKWKLNESKSELGQFANFATKMIEADQTATALNVSRTSPSFDGNETTAKETLTFDGKEAESTVFGNSKRIATASWSADGQTLTIDYKLKLEFNGESNEVKGKEVWSLTDGGKTLVVKNNSSSSFGDMESKSVYEKQ